MGRVKDHILPDGTTIYSWNITESDCELLSLTTQLDISLPNIEAVKSQTRRMEILAVNLLLCDIFDKPTEVAHHPNGAPYLPMHDCNISISHTKGVVAIAINYRYMVGLDVETIRERVLKIRDKFINEDEKAYIKPDNLVANVIAWTSKEALFKVIPQDGIDFRQHLHLHEFHLPKEGTQMVHSAHTTRLSPSKEYKLTTYINDEYIMTVATPIQ